MESVAVVFLELGGVILALAVLARASRRLGLSPIPLYLLAGLAIGEGGILPLVTSEDFIRVGADLGVIMLLLLLGLEYSADELLENMRSIAPTGLVDLVLNFVPGLLVGLVLGWGALGAAFLGGVTYISSSGLVAKLIDDLGWLGNRETPIVLSLLVFEDLVMAVYLPVMTILALQAGLLGGMLSVVGALVAVAAFLLLARRSGEALSRALFIPSDEAILLTIVGIALLVAGLAEQLHISAAVGAFLVGITVSGPAADRVRTLLTPLRHLFAAVFFLFFGLRTDPADLPAVAGLVVVLALVTAATKLVTARVGAKRVGVGSPGAWRAGTVLVARGEFSIVIAGLGVAAGVDPGLGPVAAGYVLMMAVLGPILAKLADRLTVARAARSE